MTTRAPEVVVVGRLDEQSLAELREHTTVRALPAAEEAVFAPEAALPLDGAKGLVIVGQFRVDASLLDRTPQLRVVSMRAVGYDRVDIAECTRRRIAVCNTPEVLDQSVAELTILLMLAAARRIPTDMIAPELPVRPLFGAAGLGVELAGAYLGIVGMGRIGRRVATIASAGFGMRLRHSHGDPGGLDSVASDLDELLRESDVVSLHAPLNQATRQMIGRRELALMPPDAVLVNTSRGDLIDEAALADALRSGAIRGAGLDVTSQEPLDAASPLFGAPNLFVTAHVASATVSARRAMGDLAVRNLLAVLTGEPPPACVNPEVL